MAATVDSPFNRVVGSLDELRAIIGEPAERSVKKETATLDGYARDFIAHSPFLLLATSGGDGRCDVSPKGDAPGFVLVLDETRLVIPDRPGNRRLDGMQNILQSGRAGAIFMIPGRDDTLRVNGRAWIVRDEDLLDRMMFAGKRPRLGIGVAVDECFFHCAKAFRRAGLWDARTWPRPDVVASFAQMLHDRTKASGTVADLECEIEERTRTQLY
jgi:PPOX class probable FMN-dependent enzyme